jgi:hypothetical protein
MTIRLVRSAAASIGANRSALEESQFPENGMFAMPHDHVVKNLDFGKLAGADEVASDADGSSRRRDPGVAWSRSVGHVLPPAFPANRVQVIFLGN